jgi:pyrroline-5-carboxylate reductase
MMLTQTLAFIGGGNMARSLIGGLIGQGLPAAQITVADPVESQRSLLQRDYGINVTASNEAACAADIIVLSVKPQELRQVAQQMQSHIADHRPLIISVAAGIRSSDLQQWLGLPVVRTMPNRPALNGCGVTGMYASTEVPAEQRQLAERIMNAVGKSVWVEQETLIDAVTAVSGSGPAYFFLLMELLEAAGVAHGLTAATARTLAIETAYGAGMMAHQGSDAPATLREQVTSKGGTTAAALAVFEAQHLKDTVFAAVKAAADRSAELAVLLSSK